MWCLDFFRQDLQINLQIFRSLIILINQLVHRAKRNEMKMRKHNRVWSLTLKYSIYELNLDKISSTWQWTNEFFLLWWTHWISTNLILIRINPLRSSKNIGIYHQTNTKLGWILHFSYIVNLFYSNSLSIGVDAITWIRRWKIIQWALTVESSEIWSYLNRLCIWKQRLIIIWLRRDSRAPHTEGWKSVNLKRWNPVPCRETY